MMSKLVFIRSSHLALEAEKIKHTKQKEIKGNPRLLATKAKEIRHKKLWTVTTTEKDVRAINSTGKRPVSVQRPNGIVIRHFTDVRHICIDKLVSQTHFSSLEVCLMLEIFSCLAKRNIKRPKMTQHLESRVLRNFLIENFKVTDENTLTNLISVIASHQKLTSPTDFVKSFSTILRGDLREKAHFVFKMLDQDGNGYLSKNFELKAHTEKMFNLNIAAAEPSVDPEQPIRETNEYLFNKFDPNKKGDISFEDYFEVIRKEPLLMECCFSVFPAEETMNAFERIFLCGSEKIRQRHFVSLIGK